MNRIILIGNGFDLAHGLKTSYKDFIDWYWEEWGNKLRMSYKRVEEDRLCSFRLNDNHHDWFNTLHFIYGIISPLKHRDGIEIAEIAKNKPELCSFAIKSPLFEELNRSYETKGWVDIENEYYKYLCRAGLTHNDAKAANDDMDFIKEKLIEYLKSIQEDAINNNNWLKKNLQSVFELPFNTRDISRKWGSVARLLYLHTIQKYVKFPGLIMLLNFNYTSIADSYMPPDKSIKKIIHIHGQLSNPSSVIFGYGDELDDGYRVLSKKNDNEYLRNIKSIRYLESDCYRKILEFIESAPFQIYIMGHSCGNSDRTLLNTLFEHKNCVSIKPYYYVNENGVDNYLELVQNISRNFTDMKLMRDRVVNKTFCEPLM